MVRNSGFFDADWYLERYPDVRLSGIEPLQHFLLVGWHLGRSPGPNFSTQAYLKVNPDIEDAGMNALLHYLNHGIDEGRPLGVEKRQPPVRAGSRKRVAVFASFSAKGVLEDYVKNYLTALAKVTDQIVFVADNELSQGDREWLRGRVAHVIAGRHGEYDFGSYKRGINHASYAGLLNDASELILCNDSCYGPVTDLSGVFNRMDSRNLDFWGITQNSQHGAHIQSYFVAFRRAVFTDARFRDFFSAVRAKENVAEVVLTYEVPMTKHFAKLGYSWGTLIDNDTHGYPRIQAPHSNITHRPLFMLDAGSPFVKVKAFTSTKSNHDGIIRSLKRVNELDQTTYSAIVAHVDPTKFLNASSVSFSLIMPTHNRKSTIAAAVDSVLAQRHRNFELIIVDDGSTDGTLDYINGRYQADISAGRIIVVKIAQSGVSAARNVGLERASKDWVGYVDSDNVIDPSFLETFASLTVEHPERRTFYSWLSRKSDGRVVGQNYDRDQLLIGNFIDLGTFVHSRIVYHQCGGFDTTLKRLVDWDLIIRYTAENAPICARVPLMTYSDDPDDSSRITIRESLDAAKIHIRKKHGLPMWVSTLIPAYNHEQFIEEAVESAVAQRGNIRQEILVRDDGSKDRTREIVKRLAAKYPGIVRDISTADNRGISRTFQSAISNARGDFIAILEGDDVWTDAEKLQKQTQFLVDNPDCSMVFSKILVRTLPSKKDRFLDRHEELTKQKLDGSDFLAEPHMNLIANFSSCLFKAELLKRAPARLYEGRFNEIALAFYFERHGKIGYLNEPMSIYHQHPAGVWSGSSKKDQLTSGLATRQMVLDVADPKYAPTIKAIIEEKFRKPLLALAS